MLCASFKIEETYKIAVMNKLKPDQGNPIPFRRSHHQHLLEEVKKPNNTKKTVKNTPFSNEHGRQMFDNTRSYKAKTMANIPFDRGENLKRVNPEVWLAKDYLDGVGSIPAIHDSKMDFIEGDSWYFGEVARKEAETLLLHPPNSHGSFLVRRSETSAVGYSLSVRDGDFVKHYRIHLNENGDFFISPQHLFRNLQKLVSYYSVRVAGLCCRLSQPCRMVNKAECCNSAKDSLDAWEIPRDQIILTEKLATGYFGEVYKGIWNKTTEIAVKTLKRGSTTHKEFLAEAQMIKKLQHPKLIQLYGTCTSDEPFFIITEYMHFGSLDKYLQVYGPCCNLLQRLNIGAQVASGMAYLEKHGFIHRDLAARNVLVTEELICKIADFGLSKILKDDEYLAPQGTRFPIRWTAPEVLFLKKFSIKSDVWAFGVLLVEIFTDGQTPYPGLTNQEVVDKTTQGYRMERPPNCPKETYKMMRRCWEEDPLERPSFVTLWMTLESFCLVLLKP